MKALATRLFEAKQQLADICDVFGRLALVLSPYESDVIEGHLTSLETALAGIDSMIGMQSDDLETAAGALVEALVKQLEGTDDDRETVQGTIRHAVNTAADTLLIQHKHDDTARWLKDAHGIELCKVCDRCEPFKRLRYRPEILAGYSQADVSEPIEPDD